MLGSYGIYDMIWDMIFSYTVPAGPIQWRIFKMGWCIHCSYKKVRLYRLETRTPCANAYHFWMTQYFHFAKKDANDCQCIFQVIPSLKLTCSLNIGRDPKGNDRIPTIHFQGRAVKLQGCMSDTRHSEVTKLKIPQGNQLINNTTSSYFAINQWR